MSSWITRFYSDCFNNSVKIKLCIFDYDGTLTDGNVLIDNSGNILKTYHAQDATGINNILKEKGVKTCIMTGYSPNKSVEVMAERLKIDYLYQNVENKVLQTNTLLKNLNINIEEVAFIGDDINDLELLKKIKISACPNNAIPLVKQSCKYLCKKAGGQGAVREFIDYLVTQRLV